MVPPVILEGLLQAPLSPVAQEHIIRLLVQTHEPEALEFLVRQAELGESRVVHRAAKGAIFRLRQAGVALPAPEPALSPHRDAVTWPVAGAWANRIDCIGSPILRAWAANGPIPVCWPRLPTCSTPLT